MQGLDKITARIMDEASEQVKANIEQAEKEASQIIAASRAEAEQKRAEILDKAAAEAVEAEKRILAVAELENRKHILQTKQEMVEEAFQKALGKLLSMPVQQYSAVMIEMILGTVADGNEEVVLSSADKARLDIKGLEESINKRLKEIGKQGNIKLSSEDRDFSGGFILKRGNIEINNTFEVLLKVNREDLEHDVLRTLFG